MQRRQKGEVVRGGPLYVQVGARVVSLVPEFRRAPAANGGGRGSLIPRAVYVLDDMGVVTLRVPVAGPGALLWAVGLLAGPGAYAMVRLVGRWRNE